MRCIMFVMPVASDTHRHSRVCPFGGGGPGMDNARDSGENASADLWEIQSGLWLVCKPASYTNLCLFGGFFLSMFSISRRDEDARRKTSATLTPR